MFANGRVVLRNHLLSEWLERAQFRKPQLSRLAHPNRTRLAVVSPIKAKKSQCKRTKRGRISFALRLLLSQSSGMPESWAKVFGDGSGRSWLVCSPPAALEEKVGSRPIAKSRGIPLQNIADYWSLCGIVAPAVSSNSPTRAASGIPRTYMSCCSLVREPGQEAVRPAGAWSLRLWETLRAEGALSRAPRASCQWCVR